MTKKGRPPTNPQMRGVIQELVDRGLSTDKIITKVQQEYGKGASDRNIQRLVAKARVADDTPPWTPISEESAENAALLLPVVQAVAERTEGRWRVTQAKAKLLLWVRRLVPDLPPWVAFRLVLAYQRRSGQDTEDLDAFLAFAPWRSPEAWGTLWGWAQANRPQWFEAGAFVGPATFAKPDGTQTRYPMPAVDGMRLALGLHLEAESNLRHRGAQKKERSQHGTSKS